MKSTWRNATDMIAATSVLQQQAGDIRGRTINWESYMQSQMISKEDFETISALDRQRGKYLLANQDQCVKTLLSLLMHVSKDSTIQYILVLVDDLLHEDRTRVESFHESTAKRKECVWGPFLNLLNRSDGFIVNMSSRILAKLACWSNERMPKSDLNFYLQFLKDQLTVHAKAYIKEMEMLAKRLQSVVVHQGHHHHHHQHHHGKENTGNNTPTQYSPNAAATCILNDGTGPFEKYRDVSAEQQQQQAVSSEGKPNMTIPVLCAIYTKRNLITEK